MPGLDSAGASCNLCHALVELDKDFVRIAEKAYRILGTVDGPRGLGVFKLHNLVA
ncbi:hypothetical protein D3C76_1474000 [compost metagenome]